MYAYEVENPPIQKKRFSTSAVISAILKKLSGWGVKAGDKIDLIKLEYELSLMGITEIDFSRGLVELIELHWVDFPFNDLRLTQEGFAVFGEGAQHR